MKKLEGKVAIITGSNSGIGRAIAEAFGAEGATIIVTYNEDKRGADKTMSSLRLNNVSCDVYKLDVTDEQNVSDVFESVHQRYGIIDILVNNAGVNGSDTPVAEMDSEVFDTCIKTNLYGPFYCCRKFLQLRSNSDARGKIINISSVHESLASAGNANYNASKGGLKNFSTSLALELAEKAINVNNIAPGMTLTQMNAEAMHNSGVRQEKERHIPMGRAGQTDDIKAAAVFLASSDSDYMTGTTITIDGGLSINLGQGA